MGAVPSYLSVPVPRSPVLGVLALALAFLLSSVCKLTQQRLRRSCNREGKTSTKKVTFGSLRPVTPPRPQPFFSAALHCFSSSTVTSLSLLHLTPRPNSMERLDKNSRHNQQLRKNPPDPNAGSPHLLWPWLAAYERALQGIVEIIITVIALVNTSESVKQRCSGSQGLFLEGIPVSEALSPLCFTSEDIFSFIWNGVPCSSSTRTRGGRKLSNTLRLLFLEPTSTSTSTTSTTATESSLP